MLLAALSQKDRTEIVDVIVRYGYAVDRFDWDEYASLFVPEAAIDYSRGWSNRSGQ